ncbi:hypothetical protein ES703_106968 [subsurface metagenome]
MAIPAAISASIVTTTPDAESRGLVRQGRKPKQTCISSITSFITKIPILSSEITFSSAIAYLIPSVRFF